MYLCSSGFSWREEKVLHTHTRVWEGEKFRKENKINKAISCLGRQGKAASSPCWVWVRREEEAEKRLWKHRAIPSLIAGTGQERSHSKRFRERLLLSPLYQTTPNAISCNPKFKDVRDPQFNPQIRPQCKHLILFLCIFFLKATLSQWFTLLYVTQGLEHSNFKS